MENIAMIYTKYSEIALDNLAHIKTCGYIFYYIITTFNEMPKEISLYDVINNVKIEGHILSDNLFNAIVKEYKDNKNPKETIYQYNYFYNNIDTILSYQSGYHLYLVMEATKNNNIIIHNLNVIIINEADDSMIISFKSKNNERKSYRIKLINDIDERNKQEEKNKINNKRNRRKKREEKE